MQRANAVRIGPAGRKALRGARSASDRVEKTLLAGLNSTDRSKFIRMLTTVVSQAEANELNGGAERRRPRRTR